eukprot:1267937-Pleurochrysis_carterae.AAC.1
MISGIIPEWLETDYREKMRTIMAMRLWTGVMMNGARIQMKMWMGKKNAHKDSVQQRWDNRGKCKNVSEVEKNYRIGKSGTEGEKGKGGKGGRTREDIG